MDLTPKKTEWTTFEVQAIGPRVRIKNFNLSDCLSGYHYFLEVSYYLEAILERCAGLDAIACVLTGPLDKAPNYEIRMFGTMMDELLAYGYGM